MSRRPACTGTWPGWLTQACSRWSPSDPLRDGVSYRIAGMWLDDAEYADMVRDLVRVLQPRLANAPRKGRRRRILATVLLLGEDAK
jgi:hypothetical protein